MTQQNPIYLDYNATTPMDRSVLEAMLPYFTEKFGNASSSSHLYGWDAAEAVDLARSHVARLIGAKQKEIYFTSGSTEAINMALLGVCEAQKTIGNHLIATQTEHPAVLDTCSELTRRGFEVTYLGVDQSGLISLEELRNTIRSETRLISIIHANNETGVIQPLEQISKIAKENNILLMSDTTQSIGKIPVSVDELGLDIAVLSGHKIYGPKGVGALYFRGSIKDKIHPLSFGGGQEKKLRPGTLNVPGIVGLGKACELAQQNLKKEATRQPGLRDQLENLLMEEGIHINGKHAPRLPNVSNLTFGNIDGSQLIRTLRKIAVSQGSACSSATLEPSHVLKAMGLTDEEALASIRISLGRMTTISEIETAADEIKKAVRLLNLQTK